MENLINEKVLEFANVRYVVNENISDDEVMFLRTEANMYNDGMYENWNAFTEVINNSDIDNNVIRMEHIFSFDYDSDF